MLSVSYLPLANNQDSRHESLSRESPVACRRQVSCLTCGVSLRLHSDTTLFPLSTLPNLVARHIAATQQYSELTRALSYTRCPRNLGHNRSVRDFHDNRLVAGG